MAFRDDIRSGHLTSERAARPTKGRGTTPERGQLLASVAVWAPRECNLFLSCHALSVVVVTRIMASRMLRKTTITSHHSRSPGD
eukprot:1185379-Rhodomonas_salina.1